MIIVVMGVAGSGKTTVGSLLAEHLGWPYYEGDDYHPPSNVEKMSRGIPLTDGDRWPWLDRLGELISEVASLRQDSILACSALKQAYRDRLQGSSGQVVFVYLRGDCEVFHERLLRRPDHFMNANMLQSQLDTLEEPRNALFVDATEEPAIIVEIVKRHLRVGRPR